MVVPRGGHKEILESGNSKMTYGGNNKREWK